MNSECDGSGMRGLMGTHQTYINVSYMVSHMFGVLILPNSAVHRTRSSLVRVLVHKPPSCSALLQMQMRLHGPKYRPH
jgi:hypothetical protein